MWNFTLTTTRNVHFPNSPIFRPTRPMEPDQLFPIHKARWLRKASQIGQMFYTPMWKSRLKHSTAEFQFLLQLEIVSKPPPKKNNINKIKMFMQVWGNAHGDQKPETYSLLALLNFTQKYITCDLTSLIKQKYDLWFDLTSPKKSLWLDWNRNKLW